MSLREKIFPVRDYDLAATLDCGQAFRWSARAGGWEGVVQGHWVRLTPAAEHIRAETAVPVTDWSWLEHYLQVPLDFPAVLATFPDDAPMRGAVGACRGLRLLRQEPWECLASFILSSTKQIVQIRQIVELLCETYGEAVPVPRGSKPVFSFPTVERIAACSEAELRACKMGFRAPYLRESAQMIVAGDVTLALTDHSLAMAREELLRLPGVGRKIADCVLLFAYGFPAAFPVDVWVMKALQHFYFPKRRVALPRLQRFSETHFGPNAGYAQQYLFHHARQSNLQMPLPARPKRKAPVRRSKIS